MQARKWITQKNATGYVDKPTKLFTKVSTIKMLLSTKNNAAVSRNYRRDSYYLTLPKQLNISTNIKSNLFKLMKGKRKHILKSTTSTLATSLYIYNI